MIGLHRLLRPSVSAGRGRTAFLFCAAKALQRRRKKVDRRRCRKAITLRSDQAMRGSVARGCVTANGKDMADIVCFWTKPRIAFQGEERCHCVQAKGVRIAPESDRDGARAHAPCLPWQCRSRGGLGEVMPEGAARSRRVLRSREAAPVRPGLLREEGGEGLRWSGLAAASLVRADLTRPREPG